MKKKVTENAQQIEKNERAAELLKDLEQLHTNVMDALAQKDEIIDKQDELIQLKEFVLVKYRDRAESLEKQYTKMNRAFLVLAIIALINAILIIVL